MTSEYFIAHHNSNRSSSFQLCTIYDFISFICYSLFLSLFNDERYGKNEKEEEGLEITDEAAYHR